MATITNRSNYVVTRSRCLIRYTSRSKTFGSTGMAAPPALTWYRAVSMMVGDLVFHATTGNRAALPAPLTRLHNAFR
jgi:hypothetical protein